MMPGVAFSYLNLDLNRKGSEKAPDRKYLLKVAQSMIFNYSRMTPNNDGNEIDSNFAQLLLLHGNHS